MKSLAARVFAILLIATVAIQVASFGGMLKFIGRDVHRDMYEFMAADLDFVRNFLLSQPVWERDASLAGLNRGYYRLVLQPAGTVNPSHDNSKLRETVALVQSKLGPGVPVRPIAIEEGGKHVPGLEFPVDGAQTLLVLFADKEMPFAPPPIRVILAYLLAVALATVLAAWFAVRLATQPLSRMAAAARALGANLNAPQIPEAGPTEVAGAARAFNAMQRAIQKHLDERTQILASISHDLKTPLTRLRLRVANVTPVESRARLEADIDAMSALIQEGLDYAASEKLREQRAPLDLNRLVEDIAERGGDTGHRVETSGRVDKPYECAPRALERAIQNLVDNAVKYGGRAHIRLQNGADHVEIRVEDDGPGMPEELLHKAFDPFFRAEHSRSRETGGTGLGLSIARNLVRAHGGDIHLENRAAGGLTARVVLPLDVVAG